MPSSTSTPSTTPSSMHSALPLVTQAHKDKRAEETAKRKEAQAKKYASCNDLKAKFEAMCKAVAAMLGMYAAPLFRDSAR